MGFYALDLRPDLVQFYPSSAVYSPSYSLPRSILASKCGSQFPDWGRDGRELFWGLRRDCFKWEFKR